MIALEPKFDLTFCKDPVKRRALKIIWNYKSGEITDLGAKGDTAKYRGVSNVTFVIANPKKYKSNSDI